MLPTALKNCWQCQTPGSGMVQRDCRHARLDWNPASWQFGTLTAVECKSYCKLIWWQVVFADALSKTVGLSACHVRYWTPAVLASVWKLKPPSSVGKLNGQRAIYVLTKPLSLPFSHIGGSFSIPRLGRIRGRSSPHQALNKRYLTWSLQMPMRRRLFGFNHLQSIPILEWNHKFKIFQTGIGKWTCKTSTVPCVKTSKQCSKFRCTCILENLRYKLERIRQPAGVCLENVVPLSVLGLYFFPLFYCYAFLFRLNHPSTSTSVTYYKSK